MPVPNVENISSACEYYCHVGNVEDDHLRPRLSLLARLAEQPIFDVLRTKEQLGYMVSSSTHSTFGSMGFQILIQSEYSAAYLETRIEAFLEYFRTSLEGMTEREFETTRRGLISTNLEDPKNLHDESSSFWNAINDGQYDFAKREW
jgi:insulysin